MFSRVEARHYRCLKRIDVQLEPFNILIGPNASGKSTLIDTIGFLQDALESDVEQAVRQRGVSLREVVWKLQDEQNGFEIAVEAAVPNSTHRLRYEVAVGLYNGEIVVAGENLWLIDPLQETGRPESKQATLFPIEIDDSQPLVHPAKSKKTPRGYQLVVRKVAAGNDYFRDENTGWNITYRLAPRRLALSGVPEDDSRFPITLWFKEALRQNVQRLQLNSQLMQRLSPWDAPRTFQPDGSNLPIMVEYLHQSHPERFGWWIGQLQTTLDDLETVEVVERPEDRSKYLMITYRNGIKVPAWLLSDGTLRLLALTLIAYLPHQGAVFLIEEPENGIHPKAMESVYQSLSSVYTGQVFLATHSPLFLSLAEPDALLIFAKTASGATDIVRGLQHPILKQWERETSLEVLFAAGVLG